MIERAAHEKRVGLQFRTRLDQPGSALAEGAEAELRSGVAYEPTPIPEQRESSNTWDNARLVASAGYGLRVDAGGVPLSFEIAFQQHWLSERTHTKRATVAEQAPEFGKITTSGQIQLFAFAAGVAF